MLKLVMVFMAFLSLMEVHKITRIFHMDKNRDSVYQIWVQPLTYIRRNILFTFIMPKNCVSI